MTKSAYGSEIMDLTKDGLDRSYRAFQDEVKVEVGVIKALDFGGERLKVLRNRMHTY
jgi:hypothetical protein